MVFARCLLFRCLNALPFGYQRTIANINVGGLVRQYYTSNSLRCAKMCDSESVDMDDFDCMEDVSSNIDFGRLVNNNPEKVKQLKMLQLRLDLWRQQGIQIPQKLGENQWLDLLACDSNNSTLNLLTYFWRKEVNKKHVMELRQIRQKQYDEWKKGESEKPPVVVTTAGPVIYNLMYNSLLLRIRDNKSDKLYNYKLMMASLFSPTIIIDCTYDAYMSSRDMNIVAKQISIMFAQNRDHLFPSHLLFCGLKPDSALMHRLIKYLPAFKNPDFPFFHTTQHYLDLYPKKKLVYLTSDAKEYLQTYNKDDIYIIGAFVDSSRDEPLSRTKAKRENLRMAKFPIEKQVLLSQNGLKTLSLQKVTAIMNDLRVTNDLKYACRHAGATYGNVEETAEKKSSENNTPTLSSKTMAEQFRRKHIYDLLINGKE